MLRYSLQKMLRKTGQSSKRLLLAFKAAASSTIPESFADPLYNYKQADFSGTSFMLNPHELINNSFRWTAKEVAQYIALASYRSYAEYIASGTRSLNLLHSPTSKDAIQQNRLLRIVENRVLFYYEEDAKRRKNIWH